MKTQKIIGSNSFRAGRIYTVTYADAGIEMKGFVKDTGRREYNPFPDACIDVRRVTVVQAAGDKTWANLQRRINPSWQPSADAVAWWHVTKDNSCIVENNKTATRYLRGIPKGILSESYFIDGKLASPSEVETIRKFRKSQGGGEFVLLTLDKLENVVDETGDDE